MPGLPRAGNTVPISASSRRTQVEVRIGVPFCCAPLPLMAVKSSSWIGSSTTACVTSLPCVRAIDTE